MSYEWKDATRERTLTENIMAGHSFYNKTDVTNNIIFFQGWNQPSGFVDFRILLTWYFLLKAATSKREKEINSEKTTFSCSFVFKLGGLLPLIACESKVNRLTMQEKNDMLDVHFEADTVEMFLKCWY